MRQAFISYSTRDVELAERVCASLEKCGLRCWIAPRDIAPGDVYAAAIVTAIESCDVFILLLTPAANVSEHVVRELELAQSCKCRVVPVLVGATRPIRRIGFLIAPVQWISVGDEDPGVVERAIRSVLFSASSSG